MCIQLISHLYVMQTVPQQLRAVLVQQIQIVVLMTNVLYVLMPMDV
jgi:hypothetical protein